MPEKPNVNSDQMVQMLQQKVGNLEITVNALVAVLQEKGEVTDKEINEKAQEIVQQIKDQQQKGGDLAGGPGGQ